MIPRDHITHWRANAPWSIDAQVEQDLVISRAEDIDLVQVRPERIGKTLDRMRAVLDPWLAAPRRQFKEDRVNLVYRFESEDIPPLKMRLKIEINTREHFTELGRTSVPFEVDSPWFRGTADVHTFALDELLGTKLRALYQRKTGRDLFDLWYALESQRVDPAALVACFQRYMREGGHAVTRAQYEQNLQGKRGLPDFREDIDPLLRPGFSRDPEIAMDAVLERIIARSSLSLTRSHNHRQWVQLRVAVTTSCHNAHESLLWMATITRNDN